MPTETHILPEYRLIWQRYWGCLTRSEIVAAREFSYNSNEYDPTFRILQDFRGNEESELTHSEMILLAENLKARRQALGIPVQIVLLCPGDLGFGMARMFVTLLGEEPLIRATIFRTLDEAADFLDLPHEARRSIAQATPGQAPAD